MGVYNLDRSSPKKSLGYRGGFSDIKRRLSAKRYLLLWVLVALVPCYLLRQAMSYPSASTADSRGPMNGESASRKMLPADSERSSAGAKRSTAVGDIPVDVDGKASVEDFAIKEVEQKKSREKSVLDFLFKHNTIKPAKYDKHSGKKSKSTANTLKLRLRENFVDDGDFGVAEDNDKAEEQMWTAPPVSTSTTKAVTKEER